METKLAPKFAHNLRRWLSKSRPTHRYDPVLNDQEFSQTSFPFLRLPREIRDQIYRELLLNPYPLIVHLRRAYTFEAGTRPYPAILQTSKQIHDEAAAVLYGENTWFSAAPVSPVKFFEWSDQIYDETSSTYVVEPAPINMYLPWVKHFVLFADGPPDWFKSRVIKNGDVTLVLKKMGIDRRDLKRLVVGVVSEELCVEIANANQDWLGTVDEEAMQRMFPWFDNRTAKPVYWLMSGLQQDVPTG